LQVVQPALGAALAQPVDLLGVGDLDLIARSLPDGDVAHRVIDDQGDRLAFRHVKRLRGGHGGGFHNRAQRGRADCHRGDRQDAAETT